MINRNNYTLGVWTGSFLFGDLLERCVSYYSVGSLQYGSTYPYPFGTSNWRIRFRLLLTLALGTGDCRNPGHDCCTYNILSHPITNHCRLSALDLKKKWRGGRTRIEIFASISEYILYRYSHNRIDPKSALLLFYIYYVFIVQNEDWVI